MKWPGGARFAFTFVDDTDNATVENVKPVYDLLAECGLRTTKTVWVYPPRDTFRGQSLGDARYLAFVQALQRRGFEIALHGVGSGAFTRGEIERGLELFRAAIDHAPTMHINHAYNPCNIYWGHKRFTPPLAALMRLFSGRKKKRYYGDDPRSEHYWGDLCREIRYMRNLVFNDINTHKCDPRMPYKVPSKAACSDLWFSGSDAQTVTEANALLHPEYVDRLEHEGGFCVAYTHFASGFVDAQGNVDPPFAERLRYLAAKRGWFVPASTLLDYLRGQRNESASLTYRMRLDARWLAQRLVKRARFGK